jgi:histidyl-tRNA synthetase
MQFDADTVGSSSPAADAEVCMMAADTMEALGIPRGQYLLKINNRKVFDGVLDYLGLGGDENAVKRLEVMRSLDKYDKFGEQGVELLLGKGRLDESGAFTKGVGLTSEQIDKFKRAHKFFRRVWSKPFSVKVYEKYVKRILDSYSLPPLVLEGFTELEQIRKLVRAADYKTDRIVIDPSIVRGLEYYTGPVFECELLMDTKDEDGNTVRFGSVGGGGRYDDLVARFTGQQVPATGFSIGVSRLYSALKLVGKATENKTLAPVVVTVMDKDRQGDYWKMVQALRTADPPIRAEMYVGTSNMGKQMKYADKRGAPLVVIQGGDEKANGQVQIKDLRLGAELAANIASREEYASQRLAQVTVPEAELVAQVRKMLEG